MDPVTIIVSALVAGAAAGLQPTAEQAIRDAYDGIKALIKRKYASVSLAPLERKPESEAQQAAVKETLADEGAGGDQELLEQAEKVLAAVEQHAPETARAVGIDVRSAKDAVIELKRLRVKQGTGVDARESERFKYSGEELTVGGSSDNDPPTR